MYRENKMNKIILGLIIVGLVVNTSNASMTSSFLSKLSKLSKVKTAKIAGQLIKDSKKMKQVLNKNIKIPKLKSQIAKDPFKVLLANKAQTIISKGSFEKKFFINQKFDNQLNVIAQSSKYGDEYFVIAKNISNINPNIIKNNSVFSKYIPAYKLNKQTLENSYVELLNKNGKYGWEKLRKIGKWVANHPKISMASGAYAWYILDPNSFNEALENSGKTLTQFLMTTTGLVISGAGEAVVEKGQDMIASIKEDINNEINKKLDDSQSYILNNLFGILFIIGLFITWRKRKIIKHFLFKADDVKVTKSKHVTKEEDEF